MKTKYKVLIGILLLLVIIRLALPTIIKKYLNKTLANIENCTGHIEVVDLALYRGAYRIDGLVITSDEQDTKHPFAKIKGIDLSVSWRDIFKGAITGEIILEQPELNFVATESEADYMATGKEVDWTEQIKSLLPITITLFQIKNGQINFIDKYSEPNIDLYLKDMAFKIEDIRNTSEKKDTLPSPYELTATSVGGGKLSAMGQADLLKEIPNFDLDFKFEDADLTSLNDFAKAYGWFDFEEGSVSLYAEMALIDSSLDGYFKPILNNITILDWNGEDKDEGFFQKLYEGAIGGATELLENQREDQTAARVKINGTVSNTDVGVTTAIITLLKNAFVKPLKKDMEGRIGVSGAKILEGNGQEE